MSRDEVEDAGRSTEAGSEMRKPAHQELQVGAHTWIGARKYTGARDVQLAGNRLNIAGC